MVRLVVALLTAVTLLVGCGVQAPVVIPPRQRCVAQVGGTTAELDLEQARNAAIIAGVAIQRGLAPRAASIALATAFQESDIRNLDYGDRDSIGLFQQRPSQGWGTVAQIMVIDIIFSLDWETGDINDVAQAVQRSGVPDGYRKHVDRARILASALTGETPAAFTCLVREPPAGDLATLEAMLTRTYGTAAPLTPVPGTPAGAEIATRSTAVGWSVAAFAQAWSSGAGVRTVSHAGQSWTVSGSSLAAWATPATPTPGVEPAVVTVRLG